MTTLLGLNAYQSEALIACLAASVIWAGLLFLGAMHIERRGLARGDKLWIGALLLAILPSLAAPSLAAFGVSLRAPADDFAIAAVAPAVAGGESAVAEIAAAPASETTAGSAHPASPAAFITVDQAIDALALLYIYGAALALFIWIARQAGFMLAVGLAEPLRNERLLAAAEDWAFDFGVKAPALKRSRHVSSVCVYGALSPVILIPQDLDSRVAEDDVALMCAHEIAHLKRGDTRLFTATALARVLFWFNPIVTRIASQVELAAEEGADRLVLGAGVDRREYASCFVKGLKYAAMKQSLLPALSPGFTPADRQGRRRRLDSILSAGGERRASAPARFALAGAASIAALLAVGQAAFAVDPKAAAEGRRVDAPSKTEAPKDTLSLPVDGEVTLPFGKTYKSLEDDKTPTEHKGVDIKAAKGAPVKASARGIVVEATTRLAGKPGYGTTVVIDHGHGLISRYAHLDSYSVKIGDTVKRGDVIGAVGETGLVTGPHLHFEALKDGESVDPTLAFAPPAPAAPMWAEAELPPPPAPAEPPEPVEAAEPAEPAEPREPIVIVDDRFGAPGFHFAFGNGDTLTDRMAADLEQRLLGDIEAAEGAVYDIAFNFNGESHRFTSDEPMTPEKRAMLKKAIEEMRAHREAARIEMAKAQKEWRKQAEAMRLSVAKDAEAMKRKMADAFTREDRFAFAWKEDAEALSRDIEEARRSALEAEREAREAVYEAEREALSVELEALSDAQQDLADAIEDGLEDTLAEIEAQETAIDDDYESEEDKRIAREALREARRSIQLSRRDHGREIARARLELKRREAEITREIERLDAKMRQEN